MNSKDWVCTQLVSKKPVLFLAVLLNSVRVNIIGVRDNVPCKSKLSSHIKHNNHYCIIYKEFRDHDLDVQQQQ
jgi:hypothetical protein